MVDVHSGCRGVGDEFNISNSPETVRHVKLAVQAGEADRGADVLVQLAKPFIEKSLPPTLLLFSSSGNSPNIVELAKFGMQAGCFIITFTGFGGFLRNCANISVHVDSDDYEVVEPAHDALLHRVQYHLRNAK